MGRRFSRRRRSFRKGKKRFYRKRKTVRKLKRALRTGRRHMKHQQINVKLRAPEFFTNSAFPSGNVQRGSLVFSVADCVHAGLYLNLFNFYRINKVVIRFESQQDMVTTPYVLHSDNSYPTAADRGELFTAIDYQNDTTPADADAMLSYPNVRRTPGARSQTIVLVPAMRGMLYESAVSTGYRPIYKRWIDRNDPTVPHYGIKWVAQNISSIQSGVGELIPRYRIVRTFYVSFKDPVLGLYSTVPSLSKLKLKEGNHSDSDTEIETEEPKVEEKKDEKKKD